MSSPQRLAVKLCSVSPNALKTAERRRRILEDGLPSKHGTVLGSGAFGTVYKASYKGDQVAAKVMQTAKCTGALNSEMHASFLRHSNIVKILMIEQGTCLSLITMELCGTTLQDRLDNTALSKNERVSILRGVTCALQFCHNAGIVHADVKPKNILMSADDQPKLTDFGSSVLIGESDETFEFHGTPGYTAPEVLKGCKPTPAADIYSLGIVAWQMLSRKIPFADLHSHTVIYLSAKGNRPKDNHLNDEFSDGYKALYRKMWSQSVTERPTSNQIIREIDTLIAQ
ncbi:proto-oncogene serine/threonine-protein kinase mos isoform X2 [Nomia melanderi]|uniref:proto-oncogene serine/threonine-protein kinase mos isoform X2 n=1 Tax=Nomia melanderi TaxID=2448451 RepID=UPI00130465C5|nr:serine/threonine-protein kinase mos isoform X2 [Nomia melanderi]